MEISDLRRSPIEESFGDQDTEGLHRLTRELEEWVVDKRKNLLVCVKSKNQQNDQTQLK